MSSVSTVAASKSWRYFAVRAGCGLIVAGGVCIGVTAQTGPAFPRQAAASDAFAARAAELDKPASMTVEAQWDRSTAQMGWAAAARAPQAPVLSTFGDQVPVPGRGAIRLESSQIEAYHPDTRQKLFMHAGYGAATELLATAGDLDQLFADARLEPIARGASALSSLAGQRSREQGSRTDLGTQVLAIIGLIGLLAWRKLGTANSYPR